MSDVFAQASWKLRSPEFGSLQQLVFHSQRLVAMELVSPGVDNPALVARLWELWLQLPYHPHVFHPLQLEKDGRLLLRYTAIDWKHRVVRIDEPGPAAQKIATLGIAFTRIYDLINMLVSDEELGWFTCPFAKVDLNGAPRMGFVSPAGSTSLMHRVPPEVLAGWPRADERALVFAIGQLLLGSIDVTKQTKSSPLGTVIMRCLESAPDKRFPTLEDLRHALAVVGGNRNPRFPAPSPTWGELEMGIGFADLGLPTAALVRFRDALQQFPDWPLARAGEDAMLKRGADPTYQPAPRDTGTREFKPQLAPATIPRTLDWKESRSVGRKLEDEGRYADAVALYCRVQLAEPDAADVLTATARAYLGAREPGVAVDYARRALEKDQTHREAQEILAKAWFGYRHYADALIAVDAWLSTQPSNVDAHYLRAKILLGHGRLTEAREECDITTELAPSHLAAMMLRRNIDRTIKRVRGTVGRGVPVPIDLPEHLRELRDLLVSGRTDEAITILESADHASDQIAQLLRADLLLFSDRLDDSLAVFEAADSLGPANALAANLGKATVLVRLGRAEEALALCDRLVREHSAASEPHEGRAHALQALGRLADAEAAFKQALASGAQRSNAHVRLAGR